MKVANYTNEVFHEASLYLSELGTHIFQVFFEEFISQCVSGLFGIAASKLQARGIYNDRSVPQVLLSLFKNIFTRKKVSKYPQTILE